MVSGPGSVTEPRTKADEARWLAAGSPHTVKIKVKIMTGTNTLGLTMGTRPPMGMRTNVDDKIYGLGSRNVTYQDLGELPSKSGELRTYLERLYAADSGAETGAGRTAWLLRQAANLITMPVKPAVRAAAYRVMADLPGVKVLGRVSAPLGREGVESSTRPCGPGCAEALRRSATRGTRLSDLDDVEGAVPRGRLVRWLRVRPGPWCGPSGTNDSPPHVQCQRDAVRVRCQAWAWSRALWRDWT